jgi:hypothetical protein
MTIFRRIRRLTGMSAPELAERTRQALRKRMDAMSFRLPDVTSLDVSGDLSAFFFRPAEVDSRLTMLQSGSPDFSVALKDRADAILAHRFSLLGYRDLHYGDPVDWHLDAVSGRRSPLLPWHKIPILDIQVVGDHKVIWELNRHQHFPVLAQAYLLTREDKYLKELQAQWRSWWEHNPYPLGINWASSLEVAFRSLSWLWVAALFATVETTRDFRKEILRALALNGWYLQRYLSTYSSPNTHLLGEGVGLFFIGTCCRELSASQRWQQIGYKIISHHACTKVLPDGSYYELSTHYHVYALDFLLHTRLLAEATQFATVVELDPVIRRMLTHLRALSQSGPPPHLGDDDGGRVFDGQRNRAEHLTDPLYLGATFFHDRSYLVPDLRPTAEAAWLTGAAMEVASREGDQKPHHAAFPDSGLCAMAFDRQLLVADAGGLGGESGGHGHADALALTWAVGGKQILVDAGTCCYVGKQGIRDHYRSTAAHNTVCVQRKSQANPGAPFQWRTSFDTSVLCWHAEADFAAWQAGVNCKHAGYTHVRSVFSLRGRFWVIVDRIAADFEVTAEQNWHFHPDCVLAESGSGVKLNARGRLLDGQVHSPGARISLASSGYSPAYGVELPAPVLSFQAEGKEFAFTTMLLPHSQANPVRLTGVGADGLRFSDEMVLCSNGRGWSCAEAESDATFLYLRLAGGEHPAFILVNATFLKVDGELLFQSAERTTQAMHVAAAAEGRGAS